MNGKLVRQRLARTHFNYGKSLVANGRAKRGREKIMEAVRLNPRCLKPYLCLGESLLGDSAITAVKPWKRPS